MATLTQDRLTREIMKVIPSYSLQPAMAYEIEGRLGVVVITDNFYPKQFKKFYDSVIRGIANSPYIKEENTLVFYPTKINGEPSQNKIYIFSWNNPEEKYQAYEAKLAKELEELLELQKNVLARKELILEASKDLLVAKKEVKLAKELEVA